MNGRYSTNSGFLEKERLQRNCCFNLPWWV